MEKEFHDTEYRFRIFCPHCLERMQVLSKTNYWDSIERGNGPIIKCVSCGKEVKLLPGNSLLIRQKIFSDLYHGDKIFVLNKENFKFDIFSLAEDPILHENGKCDLICSSYIKFMDIPSNDMSYSNDEYRIATEIEDLSFYIRIMREHVKNGIDSLFKYMDEMTYGYKDLKFGKHSISVPDLLDHDFVVRSRKDYGKK